MMLLHSPRVLALLLLMVARLCFYIKICISDNQSCCIHQAKGDCKRGDMTLSMSSKLIYFAANMFINNSPLSRVLFENKPISNSYFYSKTSYCSRLNYHIASSDHQLITQALSPLCRYRKKRIRL